MGGARKWTTLLKIIRQVSALLVGEQRRKLVIVAAMLVVRAGAELIGIASIMPFMGVVADSSTIHTNPYLSWAYTQFGFTTDTSFIMAFGVAVVIFLVLANAFSALTVYATTRFSWSLHHELSTRLLVSYLAQPYDFFVQRNSASFSKSILSECQEVVRSLILPLLNAVAKAITILAITTLLVVMEPLLALGVVVILGGAYGGVFLAIKKQQRRLGRERLEANEQRFKVAGEAFGGIKDVKVLQREGSFISRFRPASRTYSTAMAINTTISQVPRYLFEVMAFGGIILIVLYYLSTGRGIGQILPILSLYAFAGYRLMPELQQLFQAITQIRFTKPALDSLTADLETIKKKQWSSDLEAAPKSLEFNTDITIDDVIFSYPDADEPALNRVNMVIPKNHTVGLIGASGAGKTTLVDVLLGLYEPHSGQVLIDGVALNALTMHSWRRQVGYVPQHIFLTDDTIAANIAFGIAAENVDLEQVKEAAKTASLHNFIEAMPEGYDTVVGERGVRLSGGQRQRIGIARAVYHNPDVLLMDEATSALDGATENAVMQAIQRLSGHKTIILIAHRLTTVRTADTIWLMQNGRVQANGTYEHLLKTSPEFRELANLSS